MVHVQGSKIVLVRSYLRVSQAAGQVNILIFVVKIKFSLCMPINFVMQGKCIFSDISRPDVAGSQVSDSCPFDHLFQNPVPSLENDVDPDQL